jgi:predicted  nucleic acid-binding Zn-ribbon protein
MNAEMSVSQRAYESKIDNLKKRESMLCDQLKSIERSSEDLIVETKEKEQMMKRMKIEITQIKKDFEAERQDFKEKL